MRKGTGVESMVNAWDLGYHRISIIRCRSAIREDWLASLDGNKVRSIHLIGTPLQHALVEIPWEQQNVLLGASVVLDVEYCLVITAFEYIRFIQKQWQVPFRFSGKCHLFLFLYNKVNRSTWNADYSSRVLLKIACLRVEASIKCVSPSSIRLSSSVQVSFGNAFCTGTIARVFSF